MTSRPPAYRNVTPDAPVSRIVIRPGVGVDRATTLSEAASRMRSEGVSALLVEGGAAIVTERDISRAIGAGGEGSERVGTVATPHPVVVDGSLSIVECGGIMLESQVRHVLVAMPEGFTGVVSQRDVVAVLLRYADPALWAPTAATSENWLG